MGKQKSDILRLVSIIILMLAFIYLCLWFASSTIRQDGEAFLLELSRGDIQSARARLSPDFAAEWTQDRLTAKFGQIDPFSDVSFALVGIKGITSSMNITGTAETASGCVSVVYLSFNVTLSFDNEGIEDFDIDTNCTGNKP